MITTDWLARLVRFPSVSSAPNLDLVGVLVAALEPLGWQVETFPDPTGQKAAILARIGPAAPGGLMLSGHLDVVPAEGQAWSLPPFELTRRGTRLYGRGTTDMKGFVAAVMALAARLRPAGLRRPLYIALSYDEEVGCTGIRPMLAEIARRALRPDLVLVGEPTSMALGLGHKGKTAWRAVCHGEPRHSAEAPLAVSALHLAADLLAGLRALQAELERDGHREPGYSVPWSTVHAGVLTAGTTVNIVPARAELVFEARYPAGEDAAALAARIRALADGVDRAARPRGGVALSDLTAYPALAADPQAPAIRRLAACLPAGMPDCRLSFGTEAGLFAAALGVPVAVCGPGDMAQGHQPDEFIEEDELHRCDLLLDRAVASFCGSQG